jgi:hypothetical protein
MKFDWLTQGLRPYTLEADDKVILEKLSVWSRQLLRDWACKSSYIP